MKIRKIVKPMGAALIGASLLVSGCVSNADYEAQGDKLAEMTVQVESLIAAQEATVAEEEEVAAVEVCNPLTIEDNAVLNIVEDKYESDGVFLGTNLKVDLDEDNHAMLAEGEYSVDSNDYRYREILTVDGNVITSIDDRELESDIAIESPNERLWQWDLLFRDAVPIADVSEAHPMDIKVFGRDVRVVEVNEVAQSITILHTGDVKMYQNKCYIVDDKEVKVIRVGEASALIDVDGEIAVIPVGTSETVNFVDISLEATYPKDDVDEGLIVAKISGDIKETIKTGDGFALFGEETDSDGDEMSKSRYTAAWEFDINATELNKISVYENIDRVSLDSDEILKLLKLGEPVILPNRYIQFSFNLEDDDVESIEYKFSFVNNKLKISSDSEEGFIQGTAEYEIVYFDGVNFLDEDDLAIGISLELGETGYVLDSTLTIDGIVINADLVAEKLTALTFNGGLVDLAVRDNNLLTYNGVLITNPEDNYNSDRVVIYAPEEVPEVVLNVDNAEVEIPEVIEEPVVEEVVV